MHCHGRTIAEKCLFSIKENVREGSCGFINRMGVIIYVFATSKILMTTSICALVIYAFSDKNNPHSNNHILCTCSSAECVFM